jgi:sugar lactone lactonase YvrE
MSKMMSRIYLRGLVCALVLLSTLAFAQQVYISNEPKMSLQLLNLEAQPATLTTLYTAAGKLDDLIVNSAGQLIYTIPSLGQVDLWDPTTGQNTILTSGIKNARDLFIEPGGKTLLIASYSLGEIYRFNFSTGTLTVLAKKLKACDGIAYDPYGNLYAVANHNTIVQINPVSGAVLNTLVLEPHSGINGADGLTYDRYSGSLWATHDGTTGLGVVEIPVTAAGLGTTFSLFVSSTIKGSAPDGIKSDGQGNLYIGAIWEALVYNIPSNSYTKKVVVKGADGIALVPGPADSVAVTGGNNQTASAGTQLPQPLTVLVTDQYGDPVAGDSVTFFDGGAGGAFSNPNPVASGADGTASVMYTLPGTPQTVTITATATGVPNPAVFAEVGQ